MSKAKFYSLIDTLAVLLIGGFLIKTGIDKRTRALIDFMTTNGLSFIKWSGAILALYALGYLASKPIKTAYWLLITLTLVLSNLNKTILNFTK